MRASVAFLLRVWQKLPRGCLAMTVFAALSGILAGCASAINEKSMVNHFRAGQQFEFNKDYGSAREQYWMALANARLGGAEPETVSMLAYNFARMTGYTCHFDEAETYFVESLALEESVSGPESALTSMRLFELARLNYDQGRYDKSVGFYRRAIPIAEKLGVGRSDPIALAAALDEYGDALGRVDETAAAAARQQASRLRDANPGRQPDFVPVRYTCRSG